MIHAREDYNRIQDPEGRIPADEPVFLIRGQDMFGAMVVGMWADLVETIGGQEAIVMAARAQAQRMREWRVHKVPDLPAETDHR